MKSVHLLASVIAYSLFYALCVRAVPCSSSAFSNPTPTEFTLSITNSCSTPFQMSLGQNSESSGSNSEYPMTTIAASGSAVYVYPTGWAGRIGIGPNSNENESKIEGSFVTSVEGNVTSTHAYIDVSYVDGYSVPITCYSNNHFLRGCNIDLFSQGIACPEVAPGPVCLNPARNLPDGPPHPFFKACAGVAYTFPNDNNATGGVDTGQIVQCCIGTACL